LVFEDSEIVVNPSLTLEKIVEVVLQTHTHDAVLPTVLVVVVVEYPGL
jgi:hypothetical protein